MLPAEKTPVIAPVDDHEVSQFPRKEDGEIDSSVADPSYITGSNGDSASIRKGEVYIPSDNDAFIDPRLANYEVPLVAKTVALHNDPREPILTFRYWTLATFWVILGCGISTFYYFKPYATSVYALTVQLLSWGMGDVMARYLPKRHFTTFGYQWTMNPGPWNSKEHALIVISYWGSQHTAYGLGPLSAMELYYGRKLNAGWSILFLITTQLLGYGFVGLFRDFLVRPPKLFYPVVLPNVGLFNAMHNDPSVTKNALKFFGIVASVAFVYQWFPSLIFPMLSSLPLLCYMGHGNWIAYILGSGYSGFGMLDLTLDWNYTSYFSPFYTPLWANAHQIAGAVFACWFLYPIMYFTNTLRSKDFAAMSSGTFDSHGKNYNISKILNHDLTLNQAAMDAYSKPFWSTSYAMYFFWGFASTTGAIAYACLWYGKSSWRVFRDSWNKREDEYKNDPYLKLMADHPRVPHWWYLIILVGCGALSIGVLYGADLQLPWWGLIIIASISFGFTFPSGILFGVANIQVGMASLSEVIAGSLFPGKPLAVLTSLVFGRQILDQTLNLISDYKFGYYMKIPETELFIAQIYGTLIGPFINYGLMRFIIDNIGADTLTGKIKSSAWLALKSKNFYSISVVWGLIGPKRLFANDSLYHWVYYGFLVGPICVLMVYGVHRWRPNWNIEERLNPVVFFFGASSFPVYQTANLMTSALVSFTFMGYVYRYHAAWFRKYNYLLGIGLDCGSQVMSLVMVFVISLPNLAIPEWWGNNSIASDRCFPPSTLPPAMQ